MPEFDAKQISVVIDGETVARLDSVGYDQSKNHELDKGIDEDGDTWIIGRGEYTGSVAVKATSESIPILEELFQNNESFTLSVSYADGEPRDTSQFTNTKFDEWGPADDYAESEMPMYEGSWESARVRHN